MVENLKISVDLDRLRTLIKVDNYSYRDEFYQQFNHFKALYQLLLENPTIESAFPSKLALFLSNVIYLYSDVSDEFSNIILSLLREYSTVLKSPMIITLSKCVVILRNCKVISIENMMDLFFQLFTLKIKSLRKFIFTQLLYQIRKVSINSSIISAIQKGFYSQFSGENVFKQYLALELTMNLFDKHLWRNENNVFLLQLAAVSKVGKISVNAVRFFIRPLSNDELDGCSSSSDEELTVIPTLESHKRKKFKVSKKHTKPKHLVKSFYAIDYVRDPFEFTTNLLNCMTGRNYSFPILLDKMCLIGLLIWTHKLVIPQFYTSIQRYLKPHQEQVTRILTYLSQSVHEFLDAILLEPIVQGIISNFITERNTPEDITVGLNTIREIALKCPRILTEELLTDLIMYRKYKNKNVVMASRSLLQLYRHSESDLLPKRYRGKPEEFEYSLTHLLGVSAEPDDFLPGAIFLEQNTKDCHESDNENILSDKKVENARILSHSHIFSQSEHVTIKRKKTEHILNPKLSNQQLQLNYRLMKERSGILSVSDIEFICKKEKGSDSKEVMTKNKPKVKSTNKSSSINSKKRKNKNFMMVSHGKSVLSKVVKRKRKGFQAKNFKMKRILTKEYKKMRLNS